MTKREETPPAAIGSSLQCAYVSSDGTRCRYPGSMTISTTGSDIWFCRSHFAEKGTRYADDVACGSEGGPYDADEVHRIALASYAKRLELYGIYPFAKAPT
jgi:hypothetical protein